jgi:hypothetical protein
MTTVYSVSHSEGVFYVPTLREALDMRREILTAEDDTFVAVTKILITERLGKRALYCALLNNEGFAAAQADVI